MARRPKTNRDQEPPVSRNAAPPVPVTTTTPAWRRHALPILALWAVTLLAYANSFRSGLVFDNYFVIAQDTRIRQASAENVHLILARDYWHKTTSSALYRPLTTFSYLFNYAVLGNGAEPAGYHWVNFALHAVNIGLVYLLGLLLFAEMGPAFALAALWAVHPVLTESVTNIVGRADLLAAFGVLAALLCYARSVTADGRRVILWQVALLIVTAIGVFSKENGVVAVAAVFLYDIAYCRKAPWQRRAAGYVAVVLPIILFLVVRTQVLANVSLAIVAFTDNPLVGAGFWTARLTAVKVLGKYLWLLFWPASLSCDYSYNQIPLFSWNLGSWEDWKALLALVVYGAASAAIVLGYRRSKVAFFFIAFFVAAMAPTANVLILIGTIMAERALYLPSVGFAGLLVWAAAAASRRWTIPAVAGKAALVVICLALCGRTFARNFDWFDERTLWSSAERVSPASYKPHHHLASLLTSEREADQALAILAPLPDEQKVTLAYTTAAVCYRLKGQYQKALDALTEGRRVHQANDREIQRQNRLAGKIVGPTLLPQLYLELGRTYRGLGQYENSLGALAEGVRMSPQAEFFEEMSQSYRAKGEAPRAAISLLEGITMGSPDQVRLAAEVVELYRKTAPESCALAGNALNFECPMVRAQLCSAGQNVAALYREMHRETDAIATANAAVGGLGCPAELFR